jgi:hypothetical protein
MYGGAAVELLRVRMLPLWIRDAAPRARQDPVSKN